MSTQNVTMQWTVCKLKRLYNNCTWYDRWIVTQSLFCCYLLLHHR